MTERRFEQKDFRTAPEDRGERRPPKKGGGALEFMVILLFSFALVFGVVRPFVVEAFKIPSESMVPTLEIGDRLFVNKFGYRLGDPERGDVIVFKSVEGGGENLIKRVVGLPGDTLEVRNGALFVNGQPQREPFVNGELPDSSSYGPITIPPEHVFAMGDNRAASRDSRFFGSVPYENIEGEAFMLFWPPDRIGFI